MRILLVTAVYPGVRLGGAEVQTALLGKGLAERGHQVLYLATVAGHEQCYSGKGGVVVQELPGWGMVGRSEHQRQLKQAIVEFQPDVCYVRLLLELADISAICQRLSVPIVSISVSFKETSPLLRGGNWRETFNYWRTLQFWRHRQSFHAIQRSAVHLCNTQELAQRIQPWLPDLPVRTIYNAAPDAPPEQIHHTPGKQIIWVNNFKRLKRPELFVALARRLPQYDFLMIGAIPDQGRYGAEARQLIESAPDNLQYLGFRPLDVTNRHIGQSDLLLYTSVNEGFGNSFLQAWFRAVPTGSLSSKLDGILDREGIGFYVDNFEALVENVGQLMEDPPRRLEVGRRARAYALAHHSVDALVDAYEELFKEVVEGNPAR